MTETERVAATNAVSAFYSYTGNGVAGAVHVGHNWQQEKSVYGVEIGLRTGESADLVITPNDRFNYETDLIADIKVRYGYAFNPDTQVFASAGASLGNLNYNWVSAGVPETGSVMSRGYTLGVGVERLVGGTGAVRLSVDYHSRRSDQFQTTILPGFLYENEFDTVTLSVGYSHFFAR